MATANHSLMLDQLWQGAAEDRRYLAAHSPVVFAALYLTLNGAPYALAPHQREIIDTVFGSPPGSKWLVLEPRDHGKTETIIRGACIRAICLNRDIRILLIGKTQGTAAKSLKVIKTELEQNAKLIGDWGSFFDASGKWTDTAIQVFRTSNLKDYTVEAVGVGGAITGGHFDVIIIDDPCDDENTKTAERRRSMLNWFEGTVMPLLDPNGHAVVIGTRKHFGDLYSSLLDNPFWNVIRKQAIIQWPDSWTVEYAKDEHGVILLDDAGKPRIEKVNVVGPSKVLWPARWPIEKLIAKMESMQRTIFNREYQNEIGSDEIATVKAAWLTTAKERGKGRGWMSREEGLERGFLFFQGADLAFVDSAERAEKADSDYSVVVTIAFDPTTHDRHLARLARRRGMTQGELQTFLKTEAALFVPGLVWSFIEQNAAGRLIQLGVQHSSSLPFVGQTTGSNKVDPYRGLPVIATHFEAGRYILPYSPETKVMVDILCEELHGMGVEPHDDTVLSLWLAESAILRYLEMEAIKQRRGKGAVVFNGRNRA